MDVFYNKKVEDVKLLYEETGEIKDVYIKKKVSADNFIMVFLSTIPEMLELQGNELKLLILCWKLSTFNDDLSNEGNIIWFNKFTKDKIRKSGLDWTDGVIDNYISILCKKEMLIRMCRGTYMLNPKYFFKGTIANAKRLQLVLEADGWYAEK